MAKMNGWKVIDSTGKWIDTVYYLTNCDAEYVRKCESVYENVTVELIDTVTKKEFEDRYADVLELCVTRSEAPGTDR